MDSLRIRAYNVRFGDAILVTVPDRAPDGTVTPRNILIDVGNVLSGEGGQDEIFEPVVDDILLQLRGRPLDLYVMTHEHLDHVQGLLWAKEKRGLEIRATHAWLTASAAPGYYERFTGAKKKRLAMEDTYACIALHLAAAQTGEAARAMLLNNDPRSTADCVEHLRGVGGVTTYVHREAALSGTHPFEEATFQIWGPEEDTSVYYGPFRPMGVAAAPTGAGGAPAETGAPLPPPGVDAGAFYKLVAQRRRGIFDNLFTIDRAANDSSIVFLLEWRGWRLLFPGDAEERSWGEMGKRGMLSPVHFIKVGHHGSHNGTPGGALLDAMLPPRSHDERPRRALVSTHDGTYNNVPDRRTLQELSDRCEVVRIGEEADPLFVDLLFPDPQAGG
jgi:hypothetical protein